MFFGFGRPVTMVAPQDALPGRPTQIPGVPQRHEVLDAPLQPPFGDGIEILHVALGCFWGAEKIYWQLPGVVSTAVGYAGGYTPNPSYREVCTGQTGHTETVLVAYDPAATDATSLLATFWEHHDPTTANRQGNDVGTQYRSAIFWSTPEQRAAAEETADLFQGALDQAGKGSITTEIRSLDEAGPFYYAESEHQQYLHKNPGGYDCHVRTGVACPLPRR